MVKCVSTVVLVEILSFFGGEGAVLGVWVTHAGAQGHLLCYLALCLGIALWECWRIMYRAGDQTGVSTSTALLSLSPSSPLRWILNIICQFSPINHKFSEVLLKIPTRIFMELENFLKFI